MNTKNIFLALLCSAAFLPAVAQQAEPSAKKNIRISIVTDDNGKQKRIEREFASEDELRQFMEKNQTDFPELPPVPPVPPVAPEKPQGCKAAEKSCGERIVIIEKKVTSKDGAEIELSSPDAEDDIITENVTHEIDKEEGVEKIVIIRKLKADKPDVEERKPAAVIEEIEGPSNISEMNFFPNPNKGIFHIQFKVGDPADVKLEITDVAGKMVYENQEKNFSGWFEKDIYRGDLSNGTYLMNVKAGTESKTMKISVQK